MIDKKKIKFYGGERILKILLNKDEVKFEILAEKVYLNSFAFPI